MLLHKKGSCRLVILFTFNTAKPISHVLMVRLPESLIVNQNNGLYESYEDEGRSRFTQKPEDLALFKVPTLRNIELTAPYMHDGSISTLEEVVRHYNSGGFDHVNKSEFVKPLNLNENEIMDLVAFLESLTEMASIIND